MGKPPRRKGSKSKSHKSSTGGTTSKKKFTCDVPGCSWGGSNRSNDLKKHKKNIHENVRVICENCGESFSAYTSRARHMKTRKCQRLTAQRLQIRRQRPMMGDDCNNMGIDAHASASAGEDYYYNSSCSSSTHGGDGGGRPTFHRPSSPLSEWARPDTDADSDCDSETSASSSWHSSRCHRGGVGVKSEFSNRPSCTKFQGNGSIDDLLPNLGCDLKKKKVQPIVSSCADLKPTTASPQDDENQQPQNYSHSCSVELKDPEIFNNSSCFEQALKEPFPALFDSMALDDDDNYYSSLVDADPEFIEMIQRMELIQDVDEQIYEFVQSNYIAL